MLLGSFRYPFVPGHKLDGILLLEEYSAQLSLGFDQVGPYLNHLLQQMLGLREVFDFLGNTGETQLMCRVVGRFLKVFSHDFRVFERVLSQTEQKQLRRRWFAGQHGCQSMRDQFPPPRFEAQKIGKLFMCSRVTFINTQCSKVLAFCAAQLFKSQQQQIARATARGDGRSMRVIGNAIVIGDCLARLVLSNHYIGGQQQRSGRLGVNRDGIAGKLLCSVRITAG